MDLGQVGRCLGSPWSFLCGKIPADACLVGSLSAPPINAQFERFRRILYTPYYTTLLSLSDWEVTSALEVSESQWVVRVHVVNAYRREERDYSFFMEQRFGGKYDGYALQNCICLCVCHECIQ